MMVMLEMVSGPRQAILFTVITWNSESNCTCREKNHFFFPMKYIDVTRNTHASLDILLENRLKSTGTWMEKKNYRMHGQDSQDLQDLLYKRKGHQKDTHGPGETRSMSGGVVTLGGGVLNCWTKKQKSVALSSWESELFAAIM